MTIASVNKDGVVWIRRGRWVGRLRCRRFEHPRLAKIAGLTYCPRCGEVPLSPLVGDTAMADPEVITHHFEHCTITIDDHNHRVETTFKDGTTVPATPNHDHDSINRAHDLGYTTPDALWQMTRDHDPLHTMLAIAQGHPWSPTLHAIAHHYPLAPGVVEQEERLVLCVQRLLNHGMPGEGPE